MHDDVSVSDESHELLLDEAMRVAALDEALRVAADEAERAARDDDDKG